MNKLLTGEMVYQAYVTTRKSPQDWGNISHFAKENYAIMAKHLMEELGICSDCGARPETGLLEVAGEYWCSDCCNPPQDDPKIQYMHMVFNPDNTLAGVITPPAGMSLEEYRKQLTEEMKYIRFLLYLNTHQTVKAETIAELSSLINTHIAPTFLGRIPYYVHVYKKDDVIGYGSYVRSTTHTEITVESGAAKGLNDALYEYASSQV